MDTMKQGVALVVRGHPGSVGIGDLIIDPGEGRPQPTRRGARVFQYSPDRDAQPFQTPPVSSVQVNRICDDGT
jgi:hypothetical protein